MCTPLKCGTTWTQTIIASLLWPDGDAPAPVQQLSPWIEFEVLPIEMVRATLAAQTHRRFMKSHTPADGIPFFEAAKYIVVGRDGRDAFMSMCNHVERFKAELRLSLSSRAVADGLPAMPAWKGDVHGYFATWLAEAFHFAHIGSFWRARSDPRVLFVHYGDLKLDLAAEIGMFELAFEGGAEGFLFKGTNGRWRDVLTPDELDAYAQRAADFLPPDASAWLERGRHTQPS